MREWILGLFDRELLFKKVLEAADRLDNTRQSVSHTVNRFARDAIKSVQKYLVGLWVGFWIVVFATFAIGVLWLVLWYGFGVRSSTIYPVLASMVGFLWFSYFLYAIVAFFIVDGALALVPEAKARLIRSARPAVTVALGTILFVSLTARYDALLDPQTILRLAGAVAALSLLSFLGLMVVSTPWIKRVIVMQAVIMFGLSLFALFALPLQELTERFPRGARIIAGIPASLDSTFRPLADPKEIFINPDSPPEFFDTFTGESLVWYVKTDDGGYRTWINAETGRYDPQSRKTMEPVTQADVQGLLAWLRKKGGTATTSEHQSAFPPLAPKRFVLGRGEPLPPLVDSRDGRPLVWFSRSPEGDIKLYDGAGFDEETGTPLELADTEEKRAAIREWHRGPRYAKAARPASSLINWQAGDVPPQFFDLTTGQSLVWISGDAQTGYRFYDGQGFDGITGEVLTPVTPANRELILKWMESQTAKKQATERTLLENKRQADIERLAARQKEQEAKIREAAEQQKQVHDEFERLVAANPLPSEEPHGEWERHLRNRSATVVYADKDMIRAAGLVNRLRSLGMSVDHYKNTDIKWAGQTGHIYYPAEGFESATSIQAATADIRAWRIDRWAENRIVVWY